MTSSSGYGSLLGNPCYRGLAGLRDFDSRISFGGDVPLCGSGDMFSCQRPSPGIMNDDLSRYRIEKELNSTKNTTGASDATWAEEKKKLSQSRVAEGTRLGIPMKSQVA
jgi:hypothetical protein